MYSCKKNGNNNNVFIYTLDGRDFKMRTHTHYKYISMYIKYTYLYDSINLKGH